MIKALILAASLILAPPEAFTKCENHATIVVDVNPNWLCRKELGGDAGNGKIFLACYVPRTNVIIMPRNDGGNWWQELLAHERAHECGWRH